MALNVMINLLTVNRKSEGDFVVLILIDIFNALKLVKSKIERLWQRIEQYTYRNHISFQS